MGDTEYKHKWYWILDADWKPKSVEMMEWAEWFGKGNRILKRTQVGKGLISTIFLSVDYYSWGLGPPLLWETVTFDIPGLDQYQQRYQTKEEALKDHDEIIIAAVSAWERAHGETPKVISYSMMTQPFPKRKKP